MNTLCKFILAAAFVIAPAAFARAKFVQGRKKAHLAADKQPAAKIKPLPPLGIQPNSARYERSSINFNGLIQRAGAKQTHLEHKVKAKTAGDHVHGPATVQKKISRVNFDDVAVKFTQPKMSSSRMSVPEPRAPAMQPGAFTITMRPVKKN